MVRKCGDIGRSWSDPMVFEISLRRYADIRAIPGSFTRTTGGVGSEGLVSYENVHLSLLQNSKTGGLNCLNLVEVRSTGFVAGHEEHLNSKASLHPTWYRQRGIFVAFAARFVNILVKRVIVAGFGGTLEPLIIKQLLAKGCVVKLAQEGKFAFTGFQTGLFLDRAVRLNFLLNCKGDAPIMPFGGDDTSLTIMSLEDIGMAVANPLAEIDKTKDKFVKVQSVAVSHNQLLKYGRVARPQWKWQTVAVDTEAAYKRSQEALEKGDSGPEVMRGFLAWPSFGQGLCLFRSNENEMLGRVNWSEDRLAKLISEVIEENTGA